MYSVSFWARSLVMICLLLSGCNSKTGANSAAATNSSEEGGAPNAAEGGGGAKRKIVPVKKNVKDVEGNWAVVVTNNRRDMYRWIIKFNRGADGKFAGEFLDHSQDKDESDKPSFVSTSVDGDAVQFVVKNSHGAFDFSGTFQQGFIRGTIKTSPTELLLTRLLPTEEKSLERYGVTGLPPGSDVYEALMKSKDFKPEHLLSAMLELRTSPLTQDMYGLLMAQHIQAGFDEAKVKDLIDAYLSSARIWGTRWEARIQIAIAGHLVNGRKFSRLAIPQLDKAEKLLGDELAAFQPTLDVYREAAKVGIQILDIVDPSSTDEQRATCYTELSELVKKQPFNAEILNALAIHAEKTGQIDAAINYLSDIVALPMLEAMVVRQQAGQPPIFPNETLKKLWTEKHGSDEGYIAHIDDVYQKKIAALLEETQKSIPALPAAEAGNKAMLVELFTGMQCPPCVATDLALNALLKSYPTGKVIVIRMHQHIPLPDGLANEDTESHASFYEVSSTPTVVMNGTVIDPRFYSGPIQATPNSYGLFRQIIDSRISEKTDVALQLSAVVTDGQLTASVEATGVPEDQLPACRLRMAIVENLVHTPWTLGSNGIRDHEFVVREMLGGSKGIPPKKGELKYSITIPVADIQQHVVDYITRFEAGRRAEFPAELKPPIRGQLSLVAWVQNGNPDKQANTKMVLQSAIIPVTGETGFGQSANTPPISANTNSPSETPTPEKSSTENSTPDKPAPAEPTEPK